MLGCAMAKSDATTRVRPFRSGAATDDSNVACLDALTGALAGRVIALREGTTLIGRNCPGHLALEDDGVSRRHARLAVTADGMTTLFDLDSTNGTFVNGAPITRMGLREGDRIQIGPSAAFRFAYRTAAELRARAAEPPSAAAAVPGPAPSSPLTARELEIARLVIDGLSNDEMAQRLHLSSRTVGTHLANIYKRLEIHTRAELTRFVLERGLLGR